HTSHVVESAGFVSHRLHCDNDDSPVWRKRPPNAVERRNVLSIQDGARCRPASPSRPAASGSPRWSKASRSTHACSSTPRPCRPRETLRLRRQATLCARTPLRAYRGEYCRLERPIADGHTELLLAPTEFLRKLDSLIPPPRHHLVRFHGVFAPNAAWRKQVVPSLEQAAPPASGAPAPAVSSMAIPPAVAKAS